MKYIYLDQNKWILLARGWYSGKGELYDLVVKLKEKIQLGEVRILLSLLNINETIKQHNKMKRDNLIDFMIELSGGYTIAPYSKEINNIEIHNALAKKVGIKEASLQNMIYGRGLPGLLGKVPNIKGDISGETKKKMIEFVYSIENMRKILKDNTLQTRFYLRSKDDVDLLKKLEEARRNERNKSDKELAKKIVLVRFILDFIIEPLAKFATEYNLPKEKLLNSDDKKEDIIKLFQAMPSLYCNFCLTDRRDRELSKKIEHNDMNDIFSFSIAIPYCHIVFGEKRFVALANQSKLSSLYKTIITSSLDEFKEAIFSEQKNSD